MLTDLYPWRNDAACRGTRLSVFFPENGNYAEAREICSACIVKKECLEMALAAPDDDYGMFGGRTPNERGAIRWKRTRM